MKKIISFITSIIMITIVCSSCGNGSKKNILSSENVTITICGPWTECKAIENAAQAFNKKYPNCNVEYEYLQNYNDSVVKRFIESPESIDLILTSSIQSDSIFLPYVEDLKSHKELNLSDTNEALIKNFTYIEREKSSPEKLYCIPLGGEMRGLYVNKTLLSSLNIEVPKNETELLSACAKLKEAGYVPLNGNPGMFSQQLLFPYIANIIANSENYQETYDKVNNCADDAYLLFEKPLKLLYSFTEDGYYNYKYVETELKMFTDTSHEGQACDFFSIKNENDEKKKIDDVGSVAFMAGTMSQREVMEKIKEDYHSSIDYDFILAPVSEDGGFAYSSPAHGIAMNKNSANSKWVIEFLNFIFEKKENEQFCSDMNYIPNTKESFKTINKIFKVPKNRICDLGQVTFEYSFYNLITNSMIEISKGNNPKYMDKDESGNPKMFSYEYYENNLKAAFAKEHESMVK